MAECFAVNCLPGHTTIAVVAFLALYGPIVTLVFCSFNAGKTVTDWGGFSLQWYAVAWTNVAVQEAAWQPVVIAFWAKPVAMVAAKLAALGTARRRAFKGQTAVQVAINQPLMVPEIVMAVALLIVYALADFAPGDAAASGTRDRGGGDAGLHHLARRRGDHRVREIRRTGHFADLQARPVAPRGHARGERAFHCLAGPDRGHLTAFYPPTREGR